jgi:uncharacterized membrane protein YdjX (TVP38/TMEM64 family)
MKLRDKLGSIFFQHCQMIKKRNLKKKFVKLAGTGKRPRQMAVLVLRISPVLPFNVQAPLKLVTAADA